MSESKMPTRVTQGRASLPNARIALAVVVSSSALAMLPLTFAGCQGPTPPDDVAPAQERRPTAESDGEDLVRALDFFNELDPRQAGSQILYHLNRWVESQKPHDDWIAEPLFSQLPSRFDDLKSIEGLSELRFQSYDTLFLQEAVWMRDISRWATSDPSQDAAMTAWLDQVHASASEPARDKLAVALRLFDWTVRNVQLDTMPPTPKAVAIGPRQQDAPAENGRRDQPPEKAIAGPGAKFHAWEALLLGHGDAVHRARIFILLARQRGLDVVMLALNDPRSSAPLRPWLPAVLIEDQLYLLDMALGLPIPGGDGQGVATLQQVLADASLLRVLDLDSERPYPIKAADIENNVALIEAGPDVLSQRMYLVQEQLPPDHATVLTATPSVLARRLRQCKGIADVRLWTVPYEAIQYERKTARDREATLDHWRQTWLLREATPLAKARRFHLRGIFDGQDGARASYLVCRIPNETLVKLETSEEIQKQLGVFNHLPADEASRRNALQMISEQHFKAKQDASYWLGLVAFDSGQFKLAIDFFQNRTLQATPDGPWTHGARYNLGRSYEALGDLRQARQAYLRDKSPQRHGSLLRARRLQERIRQETDQTEAGEL